MSARARSARKSTASTLSYAEVASSADEDEESETSESERGGAASRSDTKAPTKRHKSKAKAVDVDSGDEGDEDDKPRKNPRGSAKGEQSKQKKGTGKLEILKKLPVEMITEIFSHLDPDDLLTLSMVNKQYRSLLLAKSSARLWKSARARFDLPDSTTGGFTEWQYAQLAFGKKCQECGTTKAARPDFGIRKRLCKVCRMSGILRLHWKKHCIPGIHPLARQCILRPLHTPAELHYLSRKAHALESDLRYWSGKLWELEDAASTDADESDSDDEQPAAPPPGAGPARPARRARISNQPSYKDDSSDEDDGVPEKPSRRVAAFVAARQPLLDQIEEEGKAVFWASKELREKVRARKVERVSFDDRRAQLDRAEEIADKVLELDPTDGPYVEDPAFSSHKLVKREEPLTDAEWERIKPAILKLVARIKKKHDRAAQRRRLEDRQRSLRPRYNKLKAALPASARPYMPLFIDFLVLSSVKALWQDEAVKLDDATWFEHLDDVKEELDQYRLDLILHARELIISARVDPDDDIVPSGELEDVEDLDLSEDFFDLATSFVCCAFTNCENAPVTPGRDGSNRIKGAVGPLRWVLKHQHVWHNQADSLVGSRSFRNEPQLRIVLPLEVACTVDAVLDLAKLDPADATRDDLIRFNELVLRYEWDNPGGSWKRHVWNWRSRTLQGLKTLLNLIKLEAQRAAAAKPPHSLEPPVIICHLHDAGDWNKLPIPKRQPEPGKKNDEKRPPPESSSSSDDSDSDDDDDDEPAVRSKVVKDEETDELASDSEEERVVFRARVVHDSEEDDDEDA
ncbi:hypothetical protein JCM9279_000428 [Rhodotorula babjevae]